MVITTCTLCGMYRQAKHCHYCALFTSMKR